MEQTERVSLSVPVFSEKYVWKPIVAAQLLDKSTQIRYNIRKGGVGHDIGRTNQNLSADRGTVSGENR